MFQFNEKLTWNGYDVRGLADQFHAKLAEIKLLFRGQLDQTRTKVLVLSTFDDDRDIA